MNMSRIALFAGLGLMGGGVFTAVVPGFVQSRALEALKTQTLSELVYVAGGTFTNGTYTVRWTGQDGTMEELPVRPASSSQPSAEVTLGGYYMQAHEADNVVFDVFLRATDRPAQAKNADTNLGSAGYTARMTFTEAQAYCAWLGEVSGVAMRLPTEDEWEFAARARGQTPPWATDNGQHLIGENLSDNDRDSADFDPPRARYQPSPMGFFNMADGRYEWTSAIEGDVRIAKGGSNLSSTGIETIPSRFSAEPMLKTHPLYAQMPNTQRYDAIDADAVYVINATARCVAQVSEAPEQSGFGTAPDLDAIAFPSVYILPY